MDAESILQQYAAQQGWNDATSLILCLGYINNQQDNACFEDYLRRCADEENEAAAQLED